ncbi:MAG: hypothetical protein ACOYM3_19940, partial [Terrimicrobiaceae bacterium]
MKKIIFPLSGIFVGLFLTFMAGCSLFNMGSNVMGPIAPLETEAKVAQVDFKLVLPPISNPVNQPLGTILGSTGINCQLTVRLIVFNVGNVAHPSDILSKTVLVTGGVAEVSFTGVPARPVIAQLSIEAGQIGGWTDFHGAIALKEGANTIELAPRGSGLSQDLLAELLQSIVLVPELVGKATASLVGDADSALKAASQAALASQGFPAQAAVSPTIDAFNRLVDTLKPTGYVALTSSIDMTAVQGFNGSFKLW